MELIDYDKKYLKEYKEAYLLSLQKIKEGVIKKHDLMFENPDEVDVIKKHRDSRDREKLKNGYVPSYDYMLIDNDRLIGLINIRTELTPSLLKFGGNIGYAINPKYFRKGYGTKLLELGLEKAKELGLTKVLITCDDDNIGSFKVIENNGGILEERIENNIDGEKIITRCYWIKDLDIL